MPSIRARLGFGSPSMARILRPSLAKIRARVAAIVVLPEPPFPTAAIFMIALVRYYSPTCDGEEGIIAIGMIKLAPAALSFLPLHHRLPLETSNIRLELFRVSVQSRNVIQGSKKAPRCCCRDIGHMKEVMVRGVTTPLWLALAGSVVQFVSLGTDFYVWEG